MRPALLTFLFLLIPLAGAAEAIEPGHVRNLRATAGNQRVDLAWEPPNDLPEGRTATEYVVLGYDPENQPDGPLFQRNTTEPRVSFLVTNGRTYVFQVEAILDDGTHGPRSMPIAATPALGRDMQYLAAGLIVTWVAVFGYAAWLARREAHLDRKLEQLLAHRGGRNP